MQSAAIFMKALSDGNRLRLLAAIDAQGELCACQLSRFLGVTGATCSQHLAVLVEAGIIHRRRQGRWMHFRRGTSLDEARQGIVDQVILLLRTDPAWVAEMKSLDAVMARTPADLCHSPHDQGSPP